MVKISILIKDVSKSIVLGLIISFILVVISALGAILAKHGGAKATLEVVRSALLMVGSLGLIVYAGFMLKRDARRPLENQDQWKEWFHTISFVNVFLISNIVVLISGIAVDYIEYYL